MAKKSEYTRIKYTKELLKNTVSSIVDINGVQLTPADCKVYGTGTLGVGVYIKRTLTDTSVYDLYRIFHPLNMPWKQRPSRSSVKVYGYDSMVENAHDCYYVGVTYKIHTP